MKTSIKNLILAVVLMLALCSNLSASGSDSKYYLGKSKEYLLGSGDFTPEYKEMLVKVKSELRDNKDTYNWKELEEVEYPKNVYDNYPMPINSKFNKNFYDLIIIIDNDGINDDGKFDDSDAERLRGKFGNDVVKKIDENYYIKVVTWGTAFILNIYDEKKGKTKKNQEKYGKWPRYNVGSKYGVWVTIAGEIKNYFKEHPLPKGATDEEASRRVGMLLGMPETNTGRYFAEILVKPDDLFRPTRSGSIKEGVIHDLSWSNYVLDQGKGKVTKKEWQIIINEQLLKDVDDDPKLFAEPDSEDKIKFGDVTYKFPFTGLGYTLNWTILYDKPNIKLDITDKELVGMSEFGVKKDSIVIRTGKCISTLKYIAPNLSPGTVDKHDSSNI